MGSGEIRAEDVDDKEKQYQKFLNDVDGQSRARIRQSVKRLFEDADADDDEDGDSEQSDSASPEFLEYDEEWDDDAPVEDGHVRVKEDDDSYTIRGKDLERLLQDLDVGGDFVEQAYAKSAQSSDESSNDEEVGAPQPEKKNRASPAADGNVSSEYYEELAEALKDGTRERKGVMNYFDDKNKEFMPSWLKEAYENGDEELFSGPDALRLDAEAVKRKAPNRKRDKIEDSERLSMVNASTMEEVATDFRVPLEFILDEVAALGARKPISPSDILEDRLMEDEIGKLTEVLTSFDYADLSDRYSDRTLREVAATHELDVNDVEDICGAEGIDLCLGPDTHLLKIREEQLLDALEPLLKRRS